jgi:hypothetical protein
MFFALADNRKLLVRGLEPEQEELVEVYHRLVDTRRAR